MHPHAEADTEVDREADTEVAMEAMQGDKEKERGV